MRKQIVTVALAGSLGLTGAALLVPAVAANAQTAGTTTSNPVADRLTALKDALKGLVGDDTLTQAQADRVAQTLADAGVHAGRGGHGPGGHGAGGHGPRGGRLTPEVTATAAGATVAELQAAREAGQTLAQLAASNGVSKATLVDRLVKAAETQLAADVTAGRLTQAQADAAKADLRARVTEKVDRVGGHRGGRHGAPGDAAPGTSTPGTTATPSAGA